MSDRLFYGLLAAFGATLLVAALVVVFAFFGRSGTSFSPRPAGPLPSAAEVIEHPYQFFSILDGRAVSSTAELVPRVVGVMIDNHPDARPQSGLSQAPVVYEVPVEGGTTRYYALFNAAQKVNRVGPVRSARPYFLDISQEYGDAPYIHSGGSPEALRLLKTGLVWDINEFYWGSYFWRDHTDYEAPHNLFTSSSAWQTILANNAAKRSDRTWQGWRFLPYLSDARWEALIPFAGTSSTLPAEELRIAYNRSYTVFWHYSSTTKRYERSLGETPIRDAEGIRIAADTILVQRTTVASIDSEDRKRIDLIGSGKGLVVSRGAALPATWKKDSASARTRWYDADGKELSFVPGTIWVEIVPTATVVETASTSRM